MEKVKVNKEVFEALKNAESFFDGNLEPVVIDIVNGYNFKTRENQALNTVGKDVILKIYKYGYELEEPAEEKVLRYYIERCEGSYSGRCVKDILNILNIEIKGINI